MFQLSSICDALNRISSAEKYLNILVAKVPNDPTVLSFLGQLFSKLSDPEFQRQLREEGSEEHVGEEFFGFASTYPSELDTQQVQNQALHYFNESYRFFPVDLDVISWLGVWYVKNEVYEKAIEFFTMASMMQSREVKWKLMITSCYRRMGQYQKAYELYEEVHERYPENVECLRYLIALSKDLNLDYTEYQDKLVKLESSAAPGAGTFRQESGMASTKLGFDSSHGTHLSKPHQFSTGTKLQAGENQRARREVQQSAEMAIDLHEIEIDDLLVE